MRANRSEIFDALNDVEDMGSVFDGNDYEQGELEGQAASIKLLRRFCVRLSRALIAKGVFSKKEMIDLIYEYSGANWAEYDPHVLAQDGGDSFMGASVSHLQGSAIDERGAVHTYGTQCACGQLHNSL